MQILLFLPILFPLLISFAFLIYKHNFFEDLKTIYDYDSYQSNLDRLTSIRLRWTWIYIITETALLSVAWLSYGPKASPFHAFFEVIIPTFVASVLLGVCLPFIKSFISKDSDEIKAKAKARLLLFQKEKLFLHQHICSVYHIESKSIPEDFVDFYRFVSQYSFTQDSIIMTFIKKWQVFIDDYESVREIERMDNQEKQDTIIVSPNASEKTVIEKQKERIQAIRAESKERQIELYRHLAEIIAEKKNTESEQQRKAEAHRKSIALEKANQALGFFDAMTDSQKGIKFERFMIKVLTANGYHNVIRTPDNGDYGVDIIAEKDGVKYVFQCKCYTSNAVGMDAVREILAGKGMYNAEHGYVITTSHYNQNAIVLANANHIHLIDRTKLITLIENYYLSELAQQEMDL